MVSVEGTKKMKFCAEIQYDRGYDDEGNPVVGYWVHSDVCWKCGPDSEGAPLTPEYRATLHTLLDEWLDNSAGTGAFWVGDPEYFAGWGE